jgi:hypothetical protein
LALAAGNLDKIAIRQLRRMGQNRTGDIDLIVTGKTAMMPRFAPSSASALVSTCLIR